MRELTGIFVPVPTPFKGDAVAIDRLKSNLERWNETPLDGYEILSSAGESPLLSEAERDAVLVAARAALPREKVMIAGTGSNSTLLTIRQTKRASEVGADVAAVITPHYFTRSFSAPAAQIRHYLAVAEASPIPVLIKNYPLNTGINLDADTVARIAEHPNVCGIKDSSGNIPQTAQIIHLTPKSFHVLVAAAAALVPALAIGASGGVLPLALIAPREFCQVYGLVRQGRWEEAKELAARMMLAERGVPVRYGIGGLKAALDLQGFYGGPCRAPLGTLDGDAIEDVKEILASAGLL
jgi:4-hydroxy-2-oxoglutarate aldolase